MRSSAARTGRCGPVTVVEHLEPRRLLAALPSGFAETRLATGLPNVTAIAVAPDGRLFVSEQAGRVRVIDSSGTLLPAPFIELTGVDTRGEFGLQSVAFHPDYATNGFVYVNYTRVDGFSGRQRVIRVTADLAAGGATAIPGSEVVLFDFDALDTGLFHVGGAMRFLPDGTLLVSHGDNGFFAGAASLSTTHGKMIRLNADGSIPADNPFYAEAVGKYRAIWAVGLRNPYTFDVQPGTGTIHINEVGGTSWEEINPGLPGANYGWPLTEGDFDPALFPGLTRPVLTYPHAGDACAITGGAFYNPADPSAPGAFGPEYAGDYFFSDFCGGWIRVLDTSGPAPVVLPFASGIDTPLYPTVGPDGSLYYLERGTGSVFRVQRTDLLAPRITGQPQDQAVSAGQAASFSVIASGPGLAYQWQRDGIDIAGAMSAAYVIPEASPTDSGAVFRVTVSNAFGTALSDPAVLTVLANSAPVPAIESPVLGEIYRAGDTMQFAGGAIDDEDGVLPPAALTWWVNFHHNTHFHPFVPETPGIASGSFVVPTSGETDADVFYRIHLRATDSDGASAETFVDVLPRVAQITLAAEPPGITLTLDGQPRVTPYTVTGVTGIIRELGAPATVTLGGQQYDFAGWSDGGAATHVIATPENDTTYVATFRDVTAPLVTSAGFDFDTPAPAAAHRVRFDFSESLGAVPTAGDLLLRRIDDETTVPAEAIAVDYDAGARAVVFRFPGLAGGLLADGNYRATLPAAAAQDLAGNPLAAEVGLDFFVLAGDANRDRSVDLADFGVLAARFNQPGTFSQGDFDYSGTTEIGDFSLLASRFNTSLPAPAALPRSAGGGFSSQRVPGFERGGLLGLLDEIDPSLD